MSNNKKNKVNKLFAQVVNMQTIEAFNYLDSVQEEADVVLQVAHLLSDSDTKTAFLATHADVGHVLNETEANLVGQTIAGIELTEMLGKGGMGEVYLGFDKKLQRKVAVKTIRGMYRITPQARLRFQTEARMLSKLNHENICKIYSIIEQEDVDFLVLEYIEGQSLRKNRIKDKSYSEKLQIAKSILSGLIAAHNATIVHRDLKPDNVILAKDGSIKILDFGISTSLQKDLPQFNQSNKNETSSQQISYSTTTPGKIMGTLGYMSPEQAKGKEISTASDIYSLGVLFHEIFAENHPYPKNIDKEELIKRTKKGQSEAVIGLKKDLSQLINRMKSVPIAARPTAFDCLISLQKIIDKPKRRRKQIFITTLIFLTLLGFVKYTYDLNQQKQAAISAKNQAEQMLSFMQGLFENSDPYKNQGKEITATEMLQTGAKKLDSDLKDQPMMQIRLKMTIADIYRKLGKNDLANQQLHDSLTVYKKQKILNKTLLMEIYASLAKVAFYKNNLVNMQNYLKQAQDIAEKNGLTNNG
ncbi:MAG TPA: serine/threonine protein kinase, partial [Oceanospirillales bacterium]|nr:serine/threonine protein kinase [Oceanospirillales bacterium]